VLITRPLGNTTVSDSTFSRIVPQRTELVPEARVAAMPPMAGLIV
jgi:hypothetical protein